MSKQLPVTARGVGAARPPEAQKRPCRVEIALRVRIQKLLRVRQQPTGTPTPPTPPPQPQRPLRPPLASLGPSRGASCVKASLEQRLPCSRLLSPKSLLLPRLLPYPGAWVSAGRGGSGQLRGTLSPASSPLALLPSGCGACRWRPRWGSGACHLRQHSGPSAGYECRSILSTGRARLGPSSAHFQISPAPPGRLPTCPPLGRGLGRGRGWARAPGRPTLGWQTAHCPGGLCSPAKRRGSSLLRMVGFGQGRPVLGTGGWGRRVHGPVPLGWRSLSVEVPPESSPSGHFRGLDAAHLLLRSPFPHATTQLMSCARPVQRCRFPSASPPEPQSGHQRPEPADPLVSS